MFYIGSNGYISLNRGDPGDGGTSIALTNHFARPRISALSDDLDPSSSSGNGEVSWKELADRAVITFSGVPEYGDVTGNTFQIEMFYDGRIRVTYLDLGATYGIVGVSDGSGTPSGFLETDFAAMPTGPGVVELLLPSSVVAGSGTLAGQGRIRLISPAMSGLNFNLASSLPLRVSVPSNTQINAGLMDGAFDLQVPSSEGPDGQIVTIQASATGYQIASNNISVIGSNRIPVIITNPASREVFEGQSVQFNVIAAGTAPLHYQWRHDGVPISLANNADYTIGSATMLDAGGYSVVVTNQFGSVTSEVATLTVRSGAMVAAIFADPAYLGTSSGSGNAPANVAASLLAMGYPSVLFTNWPASFDSYSCVIIPEQVDRAVSLDLASGTSQALQAFVMNGGKVIVHGGSVFNGASFLNSVFGFAVQERPNYGIALQRTAWATGTSFTNTDMELSDQSSIGLLNERSLPPGSIPVYTNAAGVGLAFIPAGTGTVFYLGWNWYDASPTGGANGGWLAVLDAIMKQSSPGAQAPRIVRSPDSHRTKLNHATAFDVLCIGQEPVTYQWYKNGQRIEGATNATCIMTNAQIADGGVYHVVASNLLGHASSEPALLTVLTNTCNVAVFGVEAVGPMLYDVTNKLFASGMFDRVDAYGANSSYPVPTLSTLTNYQAVLIFANDPGNNNTAFGNALADYVDAGGGVVLNAFCFENNAYGMGGRLLSGGYMPFTRGEFSYSVRRYMFITNSEHSIMCGVNSFLGGDDSYRDVSINPATDSLIQAYWNDGVPLVGTKQKNNGRVVGLNFYAPSSDAYLTFWDKTSDGALLMANALLWAAHKDTGASAELHATIAADTNGFVLHLTDGSGKGIDPIQTPYVRLHASGTLSLPESEWLIMTNTLQWLSNGVYRVQGLNASNAPNQYIRAIEVFP